MKKIILLLFLFSTIIVIAQNPYTYKFGGKVYENGRKLNSSEIRMYFGNNPQIIKLYNKGISKKTTGNFLLYSGLLSTAYCLNQVDKQGNQTTVVLTAGYGVLASLISIPIKIGYQKKIKKAVLLMNEEIKNQDKKVILYDIKINPSQNGIGLNITF